MKNGDSLGSMALNNTHMIRADINVGICLDKGFHNNYDIDAAASSTNPNFTKHKIYQSLLPAKGW